MALNRADIANTALRIFLQDMGAEYDGERGNRETRCRTTCQSFPRRLRTSDHVESDRGANEYGTEHKCDYPHGLMMCQCGLAIRVRSESIIGIHDISLIHGVGQAVAAVRGEASGNKSGV